MTSSSHRLPDISVIVPAFRSEGHLPRLLDCLRVQTLPPREIVVVDSTPSEATAALVRGWQGPALVYRAVDFAYPGHARNMGVALASCEWIAFIDCRTSPREDWLERSAAAAFASGADFVSGQCAWDADTPFKELVKAATFGNVSCRTLPGSVMLKSAFKKTGGFVPDVRAAEDLEWLARLERSGAKCAQPAEPNITYHGFPASLREAMRKWFVYAFGSASLEVRNDHKSLYLGLFLSLLVFFAYKWNAVFAQWEMESVLYLPNITKMVFVLVALAYFFYRGIVRPLAANVAAAYLFPWRWLGVGFVGFCLDLAKAPGLLWGALLLLKRRMTAPQANPQDIHARGINRLTGKAKEP